MPILDFHCHLGNILTPGGAALIGERRPFRYGFDPDAAFRSVRYRGQSFGDWLYKNPWLYGALTRAERRRNGCATHDNLRAAMDRWGIARYCVMPIAPHVTFADLAKAAAGDPRLLPFGSVDFAAGSVAGQVKGQLAAGAWGFKLHPIIQKVRLTGTEVAGFLRACPDRTIVLSHTGVSSYYPPELADRQRPEYGSVADFLAMAAAFPHLVFVAAHGGLEQHAELLDGLVRLPNVYVDASFSSAARLRALLRAAGDGRLLFASDWPYGFPKTSLACLREAFGRDRALAERVLYGNAERLLESSNPGRKLPQ